MDKDTRDMLMTMTAEISRLSTLVERSLIAEDDKERRIRKVERWMYGIPVAFLLTVGTIVTDIARSVGK